MASELSDKSIEPVLRFYNGQLFSSTLFSEPPGASEILEACRARQEFLHLLVGPDPHFTRARMGMGQAEWHMVMVAAE